MATTNIVLSVSVAAGVMAVEPTGSPAPETAPPTANTALVIASPSIPSPDPDGWVTYTSDRYGFTIGYPTDWSTRSAERGWTVEADADDPASPAMEHFIAPGGSIRVSAWSVPLDPDTTSPEWPGFEAWAEAFCLETGNAPCTGIHERAVPLCLERRDCHPGLLVPFDDVVQAYFSAGIYDHRRMIVVAVWSGETEPAVAPYGGAQRFLEAVLATMQVWPESVAFEERVVRGAPTPSPS